MSMKFIVAAVLAGLASAGPCDNNCGRAVAGTARASPAFADRSSLCADFVKTTTTITPPAVTETVALYNRNVHARANPSITGEIPAYASACSNAAAYWNACQCFSGVKATTVTVTASTPVQTHVAAVCTQGIEFAIYGASLDELRAQNLESGIENHENVNLNIQFDGVTPEVTGVTPTIGEIVQWTDDWYGPVRIYGVEGPPGSSMSLGVVQHRGYLVPTILGEYKVRLLTSDNAFYFWAGDKAVGGWTIANADITRFLDEGDFSYTITVSKDNIDTAVPFRFLWVNWGGPGAFSAEIVDPEGTVILGRDSVKNQQILAGCTGEKPVVPVWGAWAEEVSVVN